MTEIKSSRLGNIDFRFTLFESQFSYTAEQHQMTWSAAASYLCNPPVVPSKRKSKMIKLATFGTKTTMQHSLRFNENLLQVFGIEGDYDAGQVSMQAAADMLRAASIEAVICTTASHTANKPRWRVFAPLSRPYPPDDRRYFAGLLNAALGGVLARESFATSQGYYFGRVRDRPFDALHIQGRALDSLKGTAEPVYPAQTPYDIDAAARAAKSAAGPATATSGHSTGSTGTPFDDFRQIERQAAIDRIDSDTINALLSALLAIPADDRDTWVRMGQALASLRGTPWEDDAKWTASTSMAGKTTFILAGWTGMNVAA